MIVLEAQWGLYIEYIRETLDYNITLIPLTIIPLTSPQMQRECNDVAFEEFTKHIQQQPRLLFPSKLG
jgi:hypothetical protein